jgi:hypothetical protein
VKKKVASESEDESSSDDSSSSDDKSSGSSSDEGSMKIESDSDEGSESGSSGSSSEEEVQVLSLAERRKKWELPAHLLPKHHPKYKPLEGDDVIVNRGNKPSRRNRTGPKDENEQVQVPWFVIDE